MGVCRMVDFCKMHFRHIGTCVLENLIVEVLMG